MNQTFFVRTAIFVGLTMMLALCLRAGLAEEPAAHLPRAFVDGTGAGWKALGEKDFVNVNCRPDTWTWKNEILSCTGQPVGVIRTRQTFTNFEMVVQWRHLRPAGNSGVFVWVPEESLRS